MNDDAEVLDKDVTALVQYAGVDDEDLPLTRCVCGAVFKPWHVILHIYRDDACEMTCCERKLYFRSNIQVLEFCP